MENIIFCDVTPCGPLEINALHGYTSKKIVHCTANVSYITTNFYIVTYTSVSMHRSVNSNRNKVFSTGPRDETVEGLFGDVFSVGRLTQEKYCWEKYFVSGQPEMLSESCWSA
jgi:hypothetical protein